MHAGKQLVGNREIPLTCCGCTAWCKCSARGEASRRTTTSHRHGKSDRGVVPMKLPNKAAGAIPVAAEVVEGRPRAKGKLEAHHLSRTLRRQHGKSLMLFTSDGRSLRWRLIGNT